MKPILVVLGVVIAIMGIVFALQGADVLPTTFMIDTPWIIIGAVVALLGAGLVTLGLRISKYVS